MFPVLPQSIQALLARIEVVGGRGFVVGGALRNLMMDRPVGDWDIAATVPQNILLSAFPEGKDIGGNCGTVAVPFAEGVAEITPCRAESGYTDGRHPDHVEFTPNILTDLSRRDFTINAMAFDGEVLFDPFGGQSDLKHAQLRCVGRPAERFAEDSLRVLRLFRFASTLGFTVEWNTFVAACEAAPNIADLPRERVRNELQQILMSDGPQVLSTLVNKGALVKYGLNFAPPLTSLADVPDLPLCRWWAFCALCGADPAAVGAAFGFSRRLTADLNECTRLYRLGPAGDRMTLKKKLSAAKVDYTPVCAAFASVSPLFVAEPVILAGILLKGEPYRVQDLAINGAMLVEEGITGETCGQVLEELLAAVIRNPALNVKPVLLGLARGLRYFL